MHEFAFADAARPPRSTILRLPMRDYSLGFECLLLNCRNPLVTLDDKVFDELPSADQRQSILGAALICSNDWRGNHSGQKWIRLWGWTIRKANIALAIAEFRAYRSAGSLEFPLARMPKTPGGNWHPFGTPEIAMIHGFLTIQCRLTDLEAWDYKFGLAKMRYYAWLEAEGNIWVQNANDARQEEERRRSVVLNNPESTLVLHPKEEQEQEANHA